MPKPSWPEWTNYGLTAFCAAVGAFGVAVMDALKPWHEYLITAGWVFLALAVFFFVLAIRHSILIRRYSRSVYLYGPAFHVEPVPAWNAEILLMCFTYAPQDRTENPIARELGVEFTCVDKDTSFPWLDARLVTSPEPSRLTPLPEITFDLGLDKWKEVSIVLKKHGSDNCFLFNNASYVYPDGQNPAWKLGPGEHKIVARVTGLKESERFECIFVNPGREGSLEIKSFTPPALVPPPATP